MENNNDKKWLRNYMTLVIRAFKDMVSDDKYNEKVNKLTLKYPKLETVLYISVPKDKIILTNNDRYNVELSSNDTYYYTKYVKGEKVKSERIGGAYLISLICELENADFYANHGKTFTEHRAEINAKSAKVD